MTQRMQRPLFFWVTFILATLALLLLAGCGGTSSTTPGPPPHVAATATGHYAPSAHIPKQVVQVSIVESNGQYAFTPAAITIAKGSQVVWRDNSDASHTITSNNGAFASSGTIGQGQTFSTTFATAGTFSYHCSIHPYMKGTITVTP